MIIALYPIHTIPEDGKQYLLYNKCDGTFDVGNKPKGCFLGKWTRNHNTKEWNGVSGHFPATHWTYLPKKVFLTNE